jgi:hypothetical protein
MRVGRRATALFVCIAVALVGWVRLAALVPGGLEIKAERAARRAINQAIGGSRDLDAWIRSHPDDYAQHRDAQLQMLRDAHRFRAADGRQHSYLGDYDSYVWLRSARNFLRTGTTCDSIVDGVCRDDLALAPVGIEMRYGRSLHTAAIAFVHTVLSSFRPGYPLAASSFWVSFLLGILAVLPAYAIGRRFAGEVGGFVSAVMVGLNSTFLVRSAGSDNDVWNVFLPLCAAWAAVESICAPTRRRALVHAALAGGFTVLHALTWRGWTFGFGVVLFGFSANLTLVGLRSLRRGVVTVPGGSADWRNAVLAALVFFVAVLAPTALFDTEPSVPEAIEALASRVLPTQQANVGADTGAIEWPDTYATVGELRRPGLRGIGNLMVGTFHFFVGWLGLLLLVLPRSGWASWHFVTLIGGNYLYRYLVTNTALERWTLVRLLALPLAAAGLIYAFASRSDEDAEQRAGLLIIGWFLGAMLLSYVGARFVLLLGPPFGIAFGVAVGRFCDWLLRTIGGRWPAAVPAVVVCIGLALGPLLYSPVHRAYGSMERYRPRMNDAWAETFAVLRSETPADAIVTTWWDFGYFAKYETERRVSADGGTLGTHVSHWLARVLRAPSESESIGLLRMLNCGSDATPAPEGRLGAYGKLINAGLEPGRAYLTVVELARVEAVGARRILDALDLSESVVDDVMRSTHCQPPESYLILSDAMTGSRGWRDLSAFSPLRAFAARHTVSLTEEVAANMLAERFGIDETEARELHRDVSRLQTRRSLEAFIAPYARYATGYWRPCFASGDGDTMTCRIGQRLSGSERTLDSVFYDVDAPERTRFRFTGRGGRRGESAPAVVLLADEIGMLEIVPTASTHSRLAVLIDLERGRALVAPPSLLRSTFTHLMFLEGRYMQRFKKFDERSIPELERLVTWKISW